MAPEFIDKIIGILKPLRNFLFRVGKIIDAKELDKILKELEKLSEQKK